VWWDTDLVAKNVEEYVKKWKIDAIITFDDGGVSGHINHRAVSAGVRYAFFSIIWFLLQTLCIIKNTCPPGISTYYNICPTKIFNAPRFTSHVAIFHTPIINYNVSRR
jgi:hypothetical protein